MLKYDLFDHMLSQKHLLIAGASGSGKSVLLNGIIYNGLFHGPNKIQYIMIDVKRVELMAYKYIPHTIYYADDCDKAIDALKLAMDITEKRFTEMQRKGIKLYNGSDIYVVIDELADLMTTRKKQVTPLLQRLCQLGRAARIHVIACTQCPLASIIPTSIKVNFDSRVGLHTSTKQDSRNILEQTGLETIQVGFGLYRFPGKTLLVDIPYVTDDMIDEMVRHWRPHKSIFKRIFG